MAPIVSRARSWRFVSDDPVPRSRMHPIATVLLSLVLFIFLDGLLFRSGLYARFHACRAG